MTYRGRSDGLVVESDRKKIITFKFTCRHLRDLQGYCVHTSGVFFSFFFFSFFSPFPLGSASPQSPLWTSRPWLWGCFSSQVLGRTIHMYDIVALPFQEVPGHFISNSVCLCLSNLFCDNL